MGHRKRETLSLIPCILVFLATVQFNFCDANQLQSGNEVQAKPPGGFGSSLVFPVQGNVYPSGYFYASVSIGNPPKVYFLDIDTGSNVTWVQCRAGPSSKLLKSPHPPYQPSNNVLLCKDPVCAFVTQPSNYPCKTPNDQCDYEVEYADSGSSLGVMVRDSFPLRLTNGSAYRVPLAFGCGYDQHFSGPSPPNVDGVLGLSIGKSGIVPQLRSLGLTRNVIGHCFSVRGGGFIFIGDDLVPPRTAWIPMIPNSLNHYLLGPADLLFGDKAPVAKGLLVVFDSGSTYTYLQPQVYTAMLSLINLGLKGKPLTPVKDGSLPVCWKGAKPIRSVDEVKNYFTPLALSFTNAKNAARFALPPEAFLIVTTRGNVCLGILNAKEAELEDLNVIGDISLLGKLVIYDNEKKMIGWGAASCNNIRPKL